jgi:hypothetical protein
MRLKLTRLQQLLELGNAPQLPEPDEVHKVAICVETVLQPDRCFIRRKCLTRGLTLYYFLRRIGFDVVLCFGMGIINGEFAGHCWLIKDGEPFMETKDPRPVFAVIYSIPRSIAVPAGSQTEDQEVARP